MAKSFEAFPIALDESTDSSKLAHSAAFIKGVDSNLSITEELLDLMPLVGTTTGREECIEKRCTTLEQTRNFVYELMRHHCAL